MSLEDRFPLYHRQDCDQELCGWFTIDTDREAVQRRWAAHQQVHARLDERKH